MKKNFVLCASIFLLAGCATNFMMPSDEGTTQVEDITSTKLDAVVDIAEDVEFLKMTDEEKAIAYEPFDQIDQYSQGKKSPISYSNVVELKDEDAYTDFVLSSQKAAQIIYLGYDECPYCKAFTPKINQFAKENAVTIYYYNTRKRAQDSNFQSTIATYNVDTVPHAFIVKNGKPQAFINHQTKMAEIEAFLTKLVEMNK